MNAHEGKFWQPFTAMIKDAVSETIRKHQGFHGFYAQVHTGLSFHGLQQELTSNMTQDMFNSISEGELKYESQLI